MKKTNRMLGWVLPVVLLIPLALGHQAGDGGLRKAWHQNLRIALAGNLYDMFMPVLGAGNRQSNFSLFMFGDSINQIVPLYHYIAMDSAEPVMENQGKGTGQILFSERQVLFMPESCEEVGDSMEERELDSEERDCEEVEAVMGNLGGSREFVPHQQLVWMDVGKLGDTEALLEAFYTVDPSTTVSGTGMNAEAFMNRKFTVAKDGEGPQILIFHTHSKESFADSVPGDSTTSIVGVGEYLAEVLSDRYGYKVLHHTASYDEESRENAYSRALTGLESILQENPQIEVIIDLHRDEVREGTKLVMDLDGRPTARFMFFNGLSKTKKTGDISYLYNENRDENLAFSFQMQLMAAQYYPGLTRKIYLKGYRYNMHLRGKYLLVELGAQNNTVEEALNACDPLAHILDLVLDN